MSNLATKHRLKLNKRKLDKYKSEKPAVKDRPNLENETYTAFDSVVTMESMSQIPDFKPKFQAELGNVSEDTKKRFTAVIEARNANIFFTEFGKLDPLEQDNFMEIVNKIESLEEASYTDQQITQTIDEDVDAGDATSAAQKIKERSKIVEDAENKSARTTLLSKQITPMSGGDPEDIDNHFNEMADLASKQFKGAVNTWKKIGGWLADKYGEAARFLGKPFDPIFENIRESKQTSEEMEKALYSAEMQRFIEENADILENKTDSEREKIITKKLKQIEKLDKDTSGLEMGDFDPVLDIPLTLGGLSAISKGIKGGIKKALALTGLTAKEIPAITSSVALMNNEDMNFFSKAGSVVGVIALSGVTDSKVLKAVSTSNIKNLLVKSNNPTEAITTYLTKKGYDSKEYRRELAAYVDTVVRKQDITPKQKSKILSILDTTEAGKILPYLSNEPMYKASKAKDVVYDTTTLTKTDSPKGHVEVPVNRADKTIQLLSNQEGYPLGWMHLFEKGGLAKGSSKGFIKNDTRFINSAVNFQEYEDALINAKTNDEVLKTISDFFDNAGAYIKSISDTASTDALRKVIDSSNFKLSFLDGITNSLRNQGARHFIQELPSQLDDISKGIHKMTATAYKKAISNLNNKELKAFVEIMERGDDLKTSFSYKQVAEEFGEKVADSYKIARKTFDDVYDYSNNLYVNMFRKKGYKQTSKGDVVQILNKVGKSADEVEVRSMHTGTKYKVSADDLGEVTRAFKKIEGYIPWRYTAKYDIFKLDHSKGTFTKVTSADTSKDSVRALRDLELANSSSNVSFVRTKAGVTPTVRKEVRKSDFEDVMYRASQFSDDEISLQQMGLSAEQIEAIQRQPFAKIRKSKKSQEELKTLFERLDIYSRELAKVTKDDYISSLKEAFTREYGKFLENPKVWYSDISEEMAGSIPATTKKNIKYLQSQIRLSLNMPTKAMEKFQRKVDNFITGRALDAATGVPRKGAIKGIEKFTDNLLMTLPTAKGFVSGMRSFSFISKLGFSAVHFILQPMHMFQMMFADPDSLPRAFGDVTNLLGHKISKTFSLPYPKSLVKKAEAFLDDFNKSGMPMTTLTTDAPIVGANERVRGMQELAALPTSAGERVNKVLAASMGRRLADKLNLKGTGRTQFIREYGNRYALDLGSSYTPPLSKGVPSVTVGQFSRYFIQQFDLMFRRLNNRERYYAAKAMLHLGGVQGLPVISDVAAALEHEKRDVAGLYYKLGNTYLAPLMLTYYDKIKYADEYDKDMLKELGATKRDFELLSRASTNKEFEKTFDDIQEDLVNNKFREGAKSIIEHLHGISDLGGVVPDGLTRRLFWSGFLYDRIYGTYGWINNFGAIVSSLARGDTFDMIHHATAGLMFQAPKDPKGWGLQMANKVGQAYDEIFSSQSNVIEGVENFARLVGAQEWSVKDITNARKLSDFITSTGAELELDDRFNTVPFETIGQGEIKLKFGMRDVLLSVANITPEDRIMYYENRREWNRLMDDYKNSIDKMSDDIHYFANRGDTDRVTQKLSEYGALLEVIFGDSILSNIAAKDLQTEVWRKVGNKQNLESLEARIRTRFEEEGQFGFE